jgi:non-heme chloroperoxidase
MQNVSANDGVSMAYRQLGSGPTHVLLVHGWMVSGAVYDDLIAALDDQGLSLIVPDLRGSGASGRPASGYTIEQHAADAVAVADAAGARSFVVVGNSMGGQIALYIAAAHADRVRGAALFCPVPPSGIALPDDARGLFRGSAGNRGMQATILGLACKQLSDEARERLLDDAGKVAPAAIEQGFDAWTRGGFVEKMAEVKAPVLVVGTDDPFLPAAFLRQEVVRRVPRGTFVYLPGPGHYPQVERPRETAAILSAFVAGLPA